MKKVLLVLALGVVLVGCEKGAKDYSTKEKTKLAKSMYDMESSEKERKEASLKYTSILEDLAMMASKGDVEALKEMEEWSKVEAENRGEDTFF